VYQICPPPKGNDRFVSSFTLDVVHTNIDMWGHTTYLSAGEMNLPLLYLFFTISYVLCFFIWYTNIRSIRNGGSGHFVQSFPSNSNSNNNNVTATTTRPVLHYVHQLMSLVLILKFMSTLLESIRYFLKKWYGHAEVWSVLYTFVSCLNVLSFFTVLVLLGTGWSILTPFVEGRTKYMILLILVLQIVNNIAIVMLSQETDGETYYQTWLGVLHIVDIVCCCAVLVPIVWQISTLDKNVELRDHDGPDTIATASADDGVLSPLQDRVEATESGRLDPIVDKLKLFRTFYLVLVIYIYSTRILIYLFSSILSYRFVWVEQFFTELATLTFYIIVGILFRPVPEHGQIAGINDMDDDINNDMDDDDNDVISISGNERQSLTKNGGSIELRSLKSRSTLSVKKV
jgi:G protein-coupled receptor 107